MNRPPIIAKPRESTGLGMLLLGGLGALGIGVVLFLFDPASHGFYPRCQFHAWTGLYCPGCGSLRALHQLAHGHLGTALGSNLLLILALPLFAWAVVARFLSRAGRCGLPLNRSAGLRPGVSRETRPFAPGRKPALQWLMLAVVLGFTVLRNIPVAPFTWLAP